jgi:hypothetical protein
MTFIISKHTRVQQHTADNTWQLLTSVIISHAYPPFNSIKLTA